MKPLRSRLAVALLALLAAMPAFAGAGASYTLRVDGLACPFCAYGIEKQLSAIDGVEALKTDIEAGQVVVTMDEGARLDEAAARDAVERAGFELRAFEPPAAQ